MSLAVDTLELGPIGTNTYVVRAAADAIEAVVVDPSGDAATIRPHPPPGARCAASSSRTATSDGRQPADPGDNPAPWSTPEGERMLPEQPEATPPESL
jgi:hypothetical protein